MQMKCRKYTEYIQTDRDCNMSQINQQIQQIIDKRKLTRLPQIEKEITAQLQISVAYFCSIGLYFLV